MKFIYSSLVENDYWKTPICLIFYFEKVSNIDHEDLTNFKMLYVIDWIRENVE